MAGLLKLLAVFPHPDDETLGMGNTLARYAAEGIETHLVCATRGERGWNGPEENNPGLQSLGLIREAELRCAARHLGLYALHFLDYIDGEVERAIPQRIIGQITAHIRRISPHVVVTFPPDGHYGHPDHIAISQFTAASLLRAAETSFQDPQGQPPFTVSKFYYMVDSKTVVDTIRDTIGPISMEVDGLVRNHVGWEEWAVTTRIDTRSYFDPFWQALLCHQSQHAGLGPLLELPRETLMQLWGTGTFVRVFSLVNGGRNVEQDLFEGLR